MRHGKAESFATEDHRRRLTERGSREVRSAARWLAAEGFLPTHALVSSALRTQDTWADLAATAGIDLQPVIDDAIYSAGPDTALDLLRGVPADAEVVLYIGHNPTVASLAHLLDDGDADPAAFRAMTAGFPTAAMAVLEVHVPWPDLDAASARLVGFHPAVG
jgi:phosphohistidine phosphatase